MVNQEDNENEIRKIEEREIRIAPSPSSPEPPTPEPKQKSIKERVREIRVSSIEGLQHSYFIEVGSRGWNSHIYKDGKELQGVQELILRMKEGEIPELILKERLLK